MVQISHPMEGVYLLKMVHIKEMGRLERFYSFSSPLGSIFGVSMNHVGTMFKTDMEHVGCMVGVC